MPCWQCSPAPPPLRPRTLKMVLHSFHASMVSDGKSTVNQIQLTPEHHSGQANCPPPLSSWKSTYYRVGSPYPWFQPTTDCTVLYYVFIEINLYIMDLCGSHLWCSRVNSSCYLCILYYCALDAFKICSLNLAFSNFTMIWLGHLFILLVFIEHPKAINLFFIISIKNLISIS